MYLIQRSSYELLTFYQHFRRLSGSVGYIAILPDIDGKAISKITDRTKLCTILGTIHKMYTLRAHTKPKQTNLALEQMAIDFVLNTWDHQIASPDPDYPVSMLHFPSNTSSCIPTPLTPLNRGSP